MFRALGSVTALQCLVEVGERERGGEKRERVCELQANRDHYQPHVGDRGLTSQVHKDLSKLLFVMWRGEGIVRTKMKLQG